MSISQQSSLKNLKSGAHVHMMGICGTAMASLAGLLKDRGFTRKGKLHSLLMNVISESEQAAKTTTESES